MKKLLLLLSLSICPIIIKPNDKHTQKPSSKVSKLYATTTNFMINTICATPTLIALITGSCYSLKHLIKAYNLNDSDLNINDFNEAAKDIVIVSILSWLGVATSNLLEKKLSIYKYDLSKLNNEEGIKNKSSN